MLEKLRQLLLVKTSAFMVQVNYLLWSALLKYKINCCLDPRPVVEVLLVIALYINLWMEVLIH